MALLESLSLPLVRGQSENPTEPNILQLAGVTEYANVEALNTHQIKTG